MHTYDIYDGEEQIRTMVTAREIARDYNLDPHQIHAMAKKMNCWMANTGWR